MHLSHAAISQHPQSVNTTLNNTVYFSCVGIGTHIGWYVNATPVDSINFPPEKGIEKSDNPYDPDTQTSSSTLTVFAMESNNQSEIECFLLFNTDQIISENATLLIQGEIQQRNSFKKDSTFFCQDRNDLYDVLDLVLIAEHIKF